MRVLIIHCSYQFKGGEDTVVAGESALLKANGVDVEVLLFGNHHHTLLNLLQMPFNTSAYLKTKKKLKAFKPDVVHVHNLHFSASPSVLYAIKRAGIPFVITLHNFRLLCPSALLFDKGKIFLNSVRQKFPVDAIRRGVYKQSKLLTLWTAMSMWWYRSWGIWGAASRYIVLSRHAERVFMDSALRFRPGQIVVKPNFCFVDTPKSKTRQDYFLYIGRLSEEKGIDVLLNAFADTGIPLKIAGDGPLRSQVIKQSMQHPNIEYCGALNKDEVITLLSGCSALVFPSTWYEGMPLTIIEAFGCGTPVIASAIGVMNVMITEGYNGLHFEAGSHPDLLKKIRTWQQLKADDKADFGLNAFTTYQQHYTPEVNLKQLVSIYESVLN